MVRHYDTTQSAHNIIRKIMKNRPAALQIQQEMVEQGKPIDKTEAGATMNRESLEQRKRHEAELTRIREEMAQALKEKDKEGRRELEEAKATLQKQMKKLEKDREEMAAKYAAEKAKTNARMSEIERKVKERPGPAASGPPDPRRNPPRRAVAGASRDPSAMIACVPESPSPVETTS